MKLFLSGMCHINTINKHSGKFWFLNEYILLPKSGCSCVQETKQQEFVGDFTQRIHIQFILIFVKSLVLPANLEHDEKTEREGEHKEMMQQRKRNKEIKCWLSLSLEKHSQSCHHTCADTHALNVISSKSVNDK